MKRKRAKGDFWVSVTIRDVASKAGVSISTVSAVINGTKYVSPELRQRVESAVEELGYIPSLLGRALSSKRSSMLAYIIPDVTNPFFSSMIETVESKVFGNGFGLIVCSSQDEKDKAAQYESFLVGAHVDGVLLSPLSSRSVEEQCKPFVDRGIPVVVLAGARSIPGVDCVILDDTIGMRHLTQHLLDLGHRHIAFLGQTESYSSQLRLDAVKKTLNRANIDLHPSRIVHVSGPNLFHLPNESYRRTKELLSQAERPTAVLCHNDALAIGVLQACYDLGLRVPDDVSVTGFDDTLASITSPPLTTLRVPVEEMSRLATHILLARIEGRVNDRFADGAKVHVFGPELVVRASSGAPKIS